MKTVYAVMFTDACEDTSIIVIFRDKADAMKWIEDNNNLPDYITDDEGEEWDNDNKYPADYLFIQEADFHN